VAVSDDVVAQCCMGVNTSGREYIFSLQGAANPNPNPYFDGGAEFLLKVSPSIERGEKLKSRSTSLKRVAKMEDESRVMMSSHSAVWCFYVL
jgi:hypothetical protein